MATYLSSTELFEKYPDLKTTFKWTARNISFFLRTKLLIGYYHQNKRKTMIEENSIIDLIAFTKANISEHIEVSDKPKIICNETSRK